MFTAVILGCGEANKCVHLHVCRQKITTAAHHSCRAGLHNSTLHRKLERARVEIVERVERAELTFWIISRIKIMMNSRMMVEILMINTRGRCLSSAVDKSAFCLEHGSV